VILHHGAEVMLCSMSEINVPSEGSVGIMDGNIQFKQFSKSLRS
jgi:hypothetical protein